MDFNPHSPNKRRQHTAHLSLLLFLHVVFVFIWLPETHSSFFRSMPSLLSVHFMLVPIAGPTNKLDLLSEKSQRLVNTPFNPLARDKEYLQKEYMSIDRPSWLRLVSTIAGYWCCGIASEGRQIDIMVCCGSFRAGGSGWQCRSLIHWPWVNLSICIGPILRLCREPLSQRGSSERGLASFSARATNRKQILITLTVDFSCTQVKAIDFASTVTSKTWCDGKLWLSWLNCITLSQWVSSCMWTRVFPTPHKVPSSHNIKFASIFFKKSEKKQEYSNSWNGFQAAVRNCFLDTCEKNFVKLK